MRIRHIINNISVPTALNPSPEETLMGEKSSLSLKCGARGGKGAFCQYDLIRRTSESSSSDSDGEINISVPAKRCTALKETLMGYEKEIGAKIYPRLLVYLIFTAIVFQFSCVPNKRLVYLQHDDEELKRQNPADTVLRNYTLKKEPYRLKPEDIISLRVASITDDEYNFIKKYEEDLGIIRKLNQYQTSQEGGVQGGNINRGIGNVGNREGGVSALALDRQNTGFVLDKNGSLDLPQIGLINLSGLTIPEAEARVKDSLEGYYETPMVRIQLLNFHFTIMGEVESEGRYTSFDPEMTVFDAISLAGNLTEFADRSNVKIIRQTEGEAKVLFLNTLDESTLNAENYYLKRGDMIIVPPLQARTTNRYTVPNVSRVIGIVSGALSLMALIISLSNR